MHVLILRADLHLPASQSLKAKRSVITSVVSHVDRLAAVAAAEVDYLDKWQRAVIGITGVGNSVTHLEQAMDSVERYLWSRPEVEVLDLARSWWDEP